MSTIDFISNIQYQKETPPSSPQHSNPIQNTVKDNTPSPKTNSSEKKRQYRLCTWHLCSFHTPLLCKTLCTILVTTSLTCIPIEFNVAFVVFEDGGCEISLTQVFAIRMGRCGPFSGEMVDRSGRTTRWEKGRHRRIR